jgi:hypothetical protein
MVGFVATLAVEGAENSRMVFLAMTAMLGGGKLRKNVGSLVDKVH